MAFTQDIPGKAQAVGRSEPLENGKTVPRVPRNPGIRVGGALLVIIGALLWLAGARYTLLGWHYGLNWFAAWLGLPTQLPPIAGYAVLLAVPIGLAYSLVELRRPWTYRGKDWNAVVLYWSVWILIVVTDGGTTFLGVRQPGPSALVAAQQIAQSAALSAAWAMILTFVPEWFILGGRRLLRR